MSQNIVRLSMERFICDFFAILRKKVLGRGPVKKKCIIINQYILIELHDCFPKAISYLAVLKEERLIRAIEEKFISHFFPDIKVLFKKITGRTLSTISVSIDSTENKLIYFITSYDDFSNCSPNIDLGSINIEKLVSKLLLMKFQSKCLKD